jgi:Ca-activated chloride channel family protein
MPSSKPDYYSILGVLRDASQREIKHAYLEAAQRLHPDRNTAPGETEVFLDVQQAYEVLSNPRRRKLYDATLPPEEEEENPVVAHRVLFSRPALVKLAETQLIYALLEVSPRGDVTDFHAPPLNVCLVLDRSTSMQGEKLDILKSAAVQLLRRMRPEDVFSVVAFSDHAEAIVPASVNTDRNRQEQQIQMMQAFGATEIFHGLDAGLKEIRRTVDPSRLNHMILLTDGHTYGDEQACLNLAEEAASANIGITAMGIGHEWNDIFLDALAAKTGGSSVYISHPGDIERLLVEKFKALGSAFADEVLLEFEPREHVRINDVFRLQPEGGAIEIKPPMRLGLILRDEPLHVLFELLVEPDALEADAVTVLDGSLKASIVARPAPVPPIRLRLVREVRPSAATEPLPTAILRALSRLNLYRMQERARSAADAGEFDAAVRHLRNLATHLLSQGEHGLAKTALFEAENLERLHAWSNGGGKNIKYSTRALLLGGGKEKTG